MHLYKANIMETPTEHSETNYNQMEFVGLK
jgi:hypothetical protein